jgi:dipeptidyl aminopeptidase/acylaminoacyl peptidase
MALDEKIATRTTALRIESLLSARLFVNPQLADDRVYFVSDLAGRLSLYAMDAAGSVPEPLLPPGISLQNPELLGGLPYYVLPDLDRIIVMIDNNGDENYEPFVIPVAGGFPEPLNREAFGGRRSHMLDVDPDAAVGYFVAESNEEPVNTAYRADLATGAVETLGESMYGPYPVAWTPDHSRTILGDGYMANDVVLYENDPDRRMIWGKPIDERAEGEEHPLSGFQTAQFTASGRGLLFVNSLFEDGYGPGYIDLDKPGEVEQVALEGVVHEGQGELEGFDRIEGDRLVARFNIDGASWAYEGEFDEDDRKVTLGRVLVGQGELEGGVVHGLFHDSKSDRYVLSFCTANRPTQIYLLDGDEPTARTRERPLGVDTEHLSAGEDASFVSHDGLRVSARLYLPSPRLGYDGPRPLVYYVHGGPQGQERPNFAWFSMPLIQALTLEGFAVFVPNARGSTGYGQDYMKRVDRDWGGQDRLDHVFAMTEVLPQDDRVDTSRAGVVGRSYGGYMTLTLAGRHPELWSAAIDMFGPYDLFTFVERIPPTWKPYFELALGHPERDRDFIEERSPRKYTSNIACPLLVIQGRNDPRVVEQESHDLVEALRGEGKDVDYLVFEDEGHDVLKLPNKIRCYETIVQFFDAHLSP